jgi:hypothetical protein
MVFLAVAQVLLAFAPLTEPGVGSSAPHVEEAGTALHHSHDEAGCVACAARVLLDSAGLPDHPLLFVESSAIFPGADRASSATSATSGGLHSRAPPLISA